MSVVFVLCGVGAAAMAALRFLRIAQREHYLAGSAVRFAIRWWSTPRNVLLFPAGVVALAVTPWWEWAAFGTLAVAAAGPFGLGLRGATSPLRWTDRLRRLAGIVGGTSVALLVVGAGLSLTPEAAGIVALGMPALIDLGLLVADPLEGRLGRRWVEQAQRKLTEVAPRVLAVTGSYGKTTTKEYARLLLRERLEVVASPASFNNEMGLARAINEHLTPGTGVFIAEMGTYGPGEIAALCSWIPPEVAVITAIGPVHLERFGSLERTLEAKSEILENARVAVLNVDDQRLSALADRLEGSHEVIRCSAVETGVDVCVRTGDAGQEVWVRGERVALIEPAVAFATNAACAIGAAVAFGVDPAGAGRLLAGADRPAHRQTVAESELGFTIIDDTYNSNPAGAAAGLRLLSELGEAGRRVLVTPGMVELGPEQAAENQKMARDAAGAATDILIVGWTNRRALLAGASGGAASVMVVDSRPEAVAWVRSNLARGDAVLYENDLPDHYP